MASYFTANNRQVCESSLSILGSCKLSNRSQTRGC